RITLRGSFTIVRDGQSVLDDFPRSSSLWGLLHLLIARAGKFVSVDEIVSSIFPHGTQNPGKAMQNLVYRLRRLLPSYEDAALCPILHSREGYAWNVDAPVFVDVLELLAIGRQLEEDLSAETRKALLERALMLYRGDFLADQSYASWMAPMRMRCRHIYQSCLKQYIDILTSPQDADAAVRICRMALSHLGDDQGLHMHLIRALLSLGRCCEALGQYESTRKLLADLGQEPSAELLALGRELEGHIQPEEQSPVTVYGGLIPPSPKRGPLYCDQDAFQQVTSIYRRRMARRKLAVQLLLITITAPYPLTADEEEAAMVACKHTASLTLRRSDVITQISARQLLALLPSTPRKKVPVVVHRLQESFRERSSLTLDIQSRELLN
ncbi:MAG: hypothetical protein IJP03_06555, partial [Christensenellaceae bacterium]|nr:hypothetical protein [Christensenellaceae bacterium]